MNRIIQDKLPEVARLCERYHVQALYLFGSAARGEMTEDSDVDFLVVFDKTAIEDHFLNFFDFQFALEDLFARKVDLLAYQAIRNPVLRRHIDRDKELIYGYAS